MPQSKRHRVIRPGDAAAFAAEHGHNANPAEPRAYGVKPDSARLLHNNDQTCRALIRSYQEFFRPQLDELTIAEHGRASIPDGEFGPATQKLFELPRCGVPEHFGTAAATWPGDCRGKLTTGYNLDRLDGMTPAGFADAWDLALRNWNGALDDVTLTHVEKPESPQHVEIYAEAGPLPGGTLAWSELARNTCGITLAQKYDTLVDWYASFFTAVATHELGHALGLYHISGNGSALMNPMIHGGSISRAGFPYPADLSQCEQLGYQVASDPQPAPPDRPNDPPPTPPNSILTGELIVSNPDGTTSVYYPKLKPRV